MKTKFKEEKQMATRDNASMVDDPIQNLPVDRFYRSRENFTIVGLTGLAGSGCSTLASYMTDEHFYRHRDILRSPQSLDMMDVRYVYNNDAYHNGTETENNKAVGKLTFKRKYSICYQFIKENYKPFQLVKYTHVFWLYVLLYTAKQKGKALTERDIQNNINEILKDKYRPSYYEMDDDYKDYTGKDYNQADYLTMLQGLDIDWIGLVVELKKFSGSYFIDEADPQEDKRILSEFFFGEIFQQFVDVLHKQLMLEDYYCLCFMYHRLSYVIRGTGNPFENTTAYFEGRSTKTTHLYSIVNLINFIIKGKRKQRDADGNREATRIVIDSIRNSMEAMFLRERYTAFYLIAVHDDDNREKHLSEKIGKIWGTTITEQKKNKERAFRIFEKVKFLTDQEVSNEDYERGVFSGPNVEQCIADAEIHICNENNIQQAIPKFYTMAEQWMKYAALIQHPGLITPSPEERCMQIAYSSKFNSSCLSRQVGAVITNQYHSIRTIGWNEVPYGQIPCGLRDTRNHIRRDMITRQYYNFMYSSFERSSGSCYKGNRSFIQYLDEDYSNCEDVTTKLHGLPYPYCFKSLQNKYEGEKNQVFTRSLHAEENAMLQIVKYGGEKLKDGIIYVTASPCELCCKKLYQIGIRQIVYIDPYPGIARKQILEAGYKRPKLKLFQGAYGSTYFKLFQPFMPFKDELNIRLGSQPSAEEPVADKIMKLLDDNIMDLTDEQKKQIVDKLKS